MRRPPARTLLIGAGLLVAGLWPLIVAVADTDGSLGGWGTGFVASAVWLLVATLALQVRRARRERRRAAVYPGPAARRHDVSAVAEAMIVAAGPVWTGLVLIVDDSGRSLVVHHGGDRVLVAEPWSTTLVARIDQLDRAVGRREAPDRRLTLRVSRSGDASVTVE